MDFPLSSQENVLVLLCFNDEYCQLVRHAVTEDLFDAPYYRTIASKAMVYIDHYHTPPKDHIADMLESPQNGDPELYRETLISLYKLKDSINAKYVVDQLTNFIRDRTFQDALYRAAVLSKREEREQAQEVIRKALDFNLSLFDPGARLSDFNRAFSSEIQEDVFPTGISEFDRLGVGPSRKQLFLFLATPKAGKSWFCVHLGKIAARVGLRVCHISLEISLEKTIQRYMQSFFSLAVRPLKEEVKIPILSRDGEKLSISLDSILRPSLMDPDILSTIKPKFEKIRDCLDNIIVKEFPTATLTINKLQAYLDNLEHRENFIPDLLLVDYADLMAIDADNFRISLGQIYKDLRGIAGSRYLAVVTPSQVNRIGALARVTRGAHIAEDFSKLATADIIVVYNQTPQEAKYNLARLTVEYSRVSSAKFTVLLAQSYMIGQFCIDSALRSEEFDSDSDVTSIQ